MKDRTPPRDDPGSSDLDDPTRLEREAREQVEKQAHELRKVRLPTSLEPPTVFRP